MVLNHFLGHHTSLPYNAPAGHFYTAESSTAQDESFAMCDPYIWSDSPPFGSDHHYAATAIAILHAVGATNPQAVPHHAWASLRNMCDAAMTSSMARAEPRDFHLFMHEPASSDSHPLRDTPIDSEASMNVALSGPRAHAEIECAWAGCGRLVHAATRQAIRAHLHEYHFSDEVSTRSWRGRCQWAGCKQEKDLNFDSIPQHILTVHIGATAQRCEWCDKKFTRVDALKRHRDNGVCRKTGHIINADHLNETVA